MVSTITLWLLISFGYGNSINKVAEFASKEECMAVISAVKESVGRTPAVCIIANVVRR